MVDSRISSENLNGEGLDPDPISLVHRPLQRARRHPSIQSRHLHSGKRSSGFGAISSSPREALVAARIRSLLVRPMRFLGKDPPIQPPSAEATYGRPR